MFIATAVIAIANLCVVVVALRSNKKSDESIKSNIMLQCLEKYVMIRKDRTKATTEKSVEMARDYYREFIDLFWFEFQLWKDGLIDDHIMKAWLYSRHESYLHDEIKCISEKVSYKDVWDEMRKSRYFSPGDPFLIFMDYSHDNKVEEAMSLK